MWLSSSRILAVFCVIVLHVAAGVVINNNVGSEFWWYGNIYDSMVRWCVPVFVMLSGALLLDPNKQDRISVFYKKRISKVVVPILFWSVFFLLWTALKLYITDRALSPHDLVLKLLSGKPYYHMWFLYMILSMYLFTPFFQKITKHSSRKEIAFLVAITLIASIINTLHNHFISNNDAVFMNWFLMYIPYFFLGHFIRQDENPPSNGLLISMLLSSIILTAFGYYFANITADASAGLYFYDYLSISVIPMSISIMYLLKVYPPVPFMSDPLIKKITPLTFGVYLVHPVILDILNYIGLSTENFNPIFSIPAISFVIFIISLFGTWIIKEIPYLRRIV